MKFNQKVRSILKKAININRWAEKSDTTYNFLEEEEIEEITNKILKSLDKEGYKIKKQK